jgi:23S rRNA (adenine2503-C2)-methyltransferase
MKHDYGNSVCVTTQVGCRMGCTFCASTFGGLVRNLTAGEIVDQIVMMQQHLLEGERVSSVVLMGSGEPMENYDEVLKAIRLMHDPEGLNIGYRHITVSTSGLVPAMRKLADENIPITLALSLHAATDELRSELMPVARISQLLHGSLAHVNLIPMNPVAERPQYRRPARERVIAFRDILEEHGITATIRREMGGDIDAACGQLRNRVARTRGAARS